MKINAWTVPNWIHSSLEFLSKNSTSAFESALVERWLIVELIELEADVGGVAEDSYNEDDDDSGGSTVAVGAPAGPTPPDSPQMSQGISRAARSMSYQYPYQYTGQIIPELDIYAIPCKEGNHQPLKLI